jgi:hypothetical protein
LGNLVKAKLTLVFGNSLKIDGLKFDLLEEDFPISHFQNPKLTTQPPLNISQKTISNDHIPGAGYMPACICERYLVRKKLFSR